MFFYNGKRVRRVGFLGFGKSNKAIADYLSENYGDLEFTVRTYEPIRKEVAASEYFHGADMLSSISEDILFLSPSARRDDKRLVDAKNRGVIISSDAELFFSSNPKNVFAVTGSDGKSTTTYLTSRILAGHFRDAVPCGNFGDPLTPHIADAEGYAYVTELSSFTLNYLAPKSRRALITNITENHLDWHSSLEEYAAAKMRIYENAEEIALNYDSELTRNLARDLDVHTVYSVAVGEKELRKRIGAKNYVTVEGGGIRSAGEEILKISDIAARGDYNVANFTAAIAMSLGYHDKRRIRDIARSFTGLPHRRELIGSFRGVKYYDSAIDSTPHRTAETLSGFDGRVIVILGGRSKRLDYAPLVDALKKKAKHIVLTGESASEILDILESDGDFSRLGIGHAVIDDFIEAVIYSSSIASPGDTVVLSPAATSFDRFTNFEEKGRSFTDAVRRFAKERN